MSIQFGQDLSNSMSSLMLQLLSGNGISVPTTFHAQAKAVEKIIGQDTSGLVGSLTSFQISCSCVDTIIETGNEPLNEILNEKWLAKLNSEFRGQGIQTGLKGLMKEYFKERWQGASFPVLKIITWEEIEGLSLPVSMVFVDGGSIYAETDNKDKSQSLIGYKYFLGKDKEEEIEGEAYLMYKLFVRWFKKYPIPYLIRRGIYKPWKVLDNLKNKQTQLLNQLIPYLLEVLEGSENLEIDRQKNYDKDDLIKVKASIQELMDKLNKNNAEAPIRVSNWDEIIKHIIPDLKGMFDPTLGVSSEEAILASLGFLNLSNPTTSRKENFLNPKPFIKEVNDGIEDFKSIIRDLIELIKEKNRDTNVDHRKYTNLEWKVVSSPMVEFATEKFIELIRSENDRGNISNETMDTIINVDYQLERTRKMRELSQGDDSLMSPRRIQNTEKDPQIEEERLSKQENTIICECIECGHKEEAEEGEHCIDKKCSKCGGKMRRADRPGKGKENRNEDKEVPDDRKKGTPEAQKFNQAMQLIGAPYANVKSLPEYIRKKFSTTQQRRWMKIWNSAYSFYLKKFKGDKKKAETIAFKVANSKLMEGKIKSKLRLSKASIEETISEEEIDNKESN